MSWRADAGPGPREMVGSALARLEAATHPNDLVKALSGAAVCWRFVRQEPGPAGFVHASFQREIWSESSASGRVGLVLGALLWPATTLAAAAFMTARSGASTRRRSGVGVWRQLGQQLRLATSAGVPPYWYYLFEFYCEDQRRLARDYLYRFETKRGIYAWLRKYLSSADSTDALSDKARFAARCEAHAVAAIPALLVAERGELRGGSAPARLPSADLFQKPLRGAGGRGAVAWRYRTGRYYSASFPGGLDAEQLLAYLRSASRSCSYVLRPWVVNHPSLADLGVGALNTVRVVSCLDENDGIEITHAVLRMAREPGAIVDNFHRGGVAARVDVATGELGPATDMGTTSKTAWWTRHPVTGARIEGRKLEDWPRVLDLVRRAHSVFADQVAVGWDVAQLPTGPHLVEGNKSPDLDIIQRTHGAPLGSSRLGELLAFHLRRALQAKHGR